MPIFARLALLYPCETKLYLLTCFVEPCESQFNMFSLLNMNHSFVLHFAKNNFFFENGKPLDFPRGRPAAAAAA